VKGSQWLVRSCCAPAVMAIVIGATLSTPGFSQTPDPLSVSGKLYYHAENAYGPLELLGTAAYAGILQKLDAPKEWNQGAGAYAKRFASTVGASGIHGVLAFGLDTTLHEDPRYYRAQGRGFWRRSGHAIRGTFLTRTDSGGETVSAWRIGSDYGAAFLSNQWYPDRLNTARLGFIQGSLTMGFDLVTNLGTEFWPDVKAKLFHKK